MIGTKKIVVVLPAYNAGQTLEQTYSEIPFDIVDEVILTDDGSSDNTLAVARRLGIHHIISNAVNKGYGHNQKSCYRKALEIGADIILMLHPDYQYTPKLIHAMCYLIADGAYEVVLGSRILGKGALKGGMPIYKYIANRVLTFMQNVLIDQKLSEYHTGYRAFSRRVLQHVDFMNNSDDFIFDNQILAQIFHAGFEVAEITCPCKYFEQASSINFRRSVRYGAGVILVSLQYFLQKNRLGQFKLFAKTISEQKKVKTDKIIFVTIGAVLLSLFLVSMLIGFRENKGDKLIAEPMAVVTCARQYIEGQPKEKTGRRLDCSGFTKEVYRNFGYELPRNSSAQYRESQKVKKEDLDPGDLVFFSSSGKGVSHVGIYIGQEKFIHSPGINKPVRIDSLSNSYYENCFISGGSVIFEINKK